MTRARELARLANENVLSVEDDSLEVGINSTTPTSALDVRGQLNVGLIAQEELEVEKEHGFGDTPDNMLITHIDDGGGYGMQYSKLVPILINAVKELSAKVEELESKLNN